MKTIFRYTVSFVIVITIIFLIISGLINFILSFFPLIQISFIQLILYSFAIIGLFMLTNRVQHNLQSYKNTFSLFGFKIENPFYKPEYDRFKIANTQEILTENKNLKEERDDLTELLSTFVEELDNKDEELSEFQYISEIYIRHHKNSSRLVRSLTSLINENNPGWDKEFYNNVLDECVTVLQSDRADKSSALYFVKDGKLTMSGYNRINFSSSRTRSFLKGEGFAGNVWHKNETLLENDVEDSEYFIGPFLPNHSYGSIIGTPIRISTEIIGVLCIQSEGFNGFDRDDIDTIKYYADICALAYYYDKIKID